MAAARPEPLPPETRTVGQLVAETVRLYGRRFWRGLLVGVPNGLAGIGFASMSGNAEYVWPFTVQPLASALAFYAAVLVVTERRFDAREASAAMAVGFLVFLPVSVLTALFILPAAAWLGLIGLAVPALVLEGRGAADALRRGIQLGRADYVHSFGGFAALLAVGLATSYALFFLLRGQGEATLVSAGFLSIVVVSPLLYLGGVLLYFDQAARVVDSAAKPRRRRSDAGREAACPPTGRTSGGGSGEPGGSPG